MLYKNCICGKLILYTVGKCPKCTAKKEAMDKARKKRYRDRKEVDREMKFYNTSEWQKLRNHVVNSYMNMSVYSYCRDGKVVPAEVVHHLVEIRDSWDDRLNKYNLIPVTRKEHLNIHYRMEKEGKEKIQAELQEMLEKFREDFKIGF